MEFEFNSFFFYDVTITCPQHFFLLFKTKNKKKDETFSLLEENLEKNPPKNLGNPISHCGTAKGRFRSKATAETCGKPAENNAGSGM
ncbi:hypothetical protein JTE90_013968 [Oedothorax gibbosus]|uniref:Uncharacterized protein n=1 Tax=Oedothorax gibbosus TaxID=931172 RepID=A0AAV6UE75_9ARAC|nr:hypothetical protein JTE90_013968 [Oedothorax gibbosus]